MGISDAAMALGKSPSQIRRMCASGQLRAQQARTADGAAWLIDPACSPALAMAAGLPAADATGLAGLTAAKRQGIAWRAEVVTTFRQAAARRPEGLGLTEFRRRWCEAWNLRHGHGKARRISVRGLQRWEARIQGGILALADRRRYSGPAAMSDDARAMFDGLYCQENHLSIPRLHEIVAAQALTNGWDWPSLRTVQSYAAKTLDPKLVASGQDPKKFRDRCVPTAERDWTLVPAMGCWVGDHRRFDVLLPRMDPATGKFGWYRPWLTCWLDGRSWYPPAWRIRFEDPNGNVVMETFCQGVDACGLPASAYIDNGKDFRMRRFSGGRTTKTTKGTKDTKNSNGIIAERYVKPLLEMLGVEATFAMPYNARAKVIEPFFRQVAEGFDRTWETYCGNRIDRKPEQLKRFNGKAGEMHKAGLTIEAFSRAFEAWLLTEYCLRESPSNAAAGLSPLRAFQELRGENFQVRRPAPETLALLLMPSLPARIEANGLYVRPFGRHYWHDSLEDRRCGSGRDLRRKVVYRYRSDDDSAVYVFDAASDKFLCAATPYIGGGLHPLAAEEADREKLAALMALQAGRARTMRARLAELREFAGNTLLAASRQAAASLGRLDDPATIAGLDRGERGGGPTILKLVDPASDAAGRAAAAQGRRREGGRAPTASELMATGTDDSRPVPATGGREGAGKTAIEILAADVDGPAHTAEHQRSKEQHDEHRTAGNDRRPDGA